LWHLFCRYKKEEERWEAAVNNFFESDKVSCLDDVKAGLSALVLPSGVDVLKKEEEIVFLHIQHHNGIPHIHFYLHVGLSLKPLLCADGVPVPIKDVRHLLLDEKISSLTSISNLLALLKAMANKDGGEEMTKLFLEALAATMDKVTFNDEDQSRKLKFLQEQLRLLACPSKSRRYSPDLLAAAMMWKTTSPSLYRQLIRESVLTLPSLAHLQRLSQVFTTETGLTGSSLSYLSLRMKKLTEREKMVVLMADEIHSAQKVEYAGGKMYGVEDGSVCKTVLAFMVKSVAGSYMDMVALCPVNVLDSKLLKTGFDKILPALTELGLVVLAISMDNASPNRKYFLDLCQQKLVSCIPHPCLPDEQLFLLFDAVHDFKNLYNNFISKKEFVAPPFDIGNKDGGSSNDEQVKRWQWQAFTVKYQYKISNLCCTAINFTLLGIYAGTL
jgi:hypothetical protein